MYASFSSLTSMEVPIVLHALQHLLYPGLLLFFILFFRSIRLHNLCRIGKLSQCKFIIFIPILFLCIWRAIVFRTQLCVAKFLILSLRVFESFVLIHFIRKWQCMKLNLSIFLDQILLLLAKVLSTTQKAKIRYNMIFKEIYGMHVSSEHKKQIVFQKLFL